MLQNTTMVVFFNWHWILFGKYDWEDYFIEGKMAFHQVRGYPEGEKAYMTHSEGNGGFW